MNTNLIFSEKDARDILFRIKLIADDKSKELALKLLLKHITQETFDNIFGKVFKNKLGISITLKN